MKKTILSLSHLYTITIWLSIRSAFGDILTFVDTRWYTLKLVSSIIKGRVQFVEERSLTLFFAQYASTICVHALSAMRTVCA